MKYESNLKQDLNLSPPKTPPTALQRTESLSKINPSNPASNEIYPHGNKINYTKVGVLISIGMNSGSGGLT